MSSQYDRVAQMNEDFSEPSEELPHPGSPFSQEKEAYAHLVHYGICARGVVPNCYGWSELSVEHVKAIVSLCGPDKVSLQDDLKTGVSIKAIILEYFPNAEPLSIYNITRQIAEQAFRGLHAIHTAYVQHNNIHRDHIRVLQDGRVVWIDFDKAWCPSQNKVAASSVSQGSKGEGQDQHEVTRLSLFQELNQGWDYMYQTMVSEFNKT